MLMLREAQSLLWEEEAYEDHLSSLTNHVQAAEKEAEAHKESISYSRVKILKIQAILKKRGLHFENP